MLSKLNVYLKCNVGDKIEGTICYVKNLTSSFGCLHVFTHKVDYTSHMLYIYVR